MKILKFLLFFGGTMILLLTFQNVMAQNADAVQAAPSFFQKIGNWIQGNLMGMGVIFIGGILAKSGWTLIIKKIAAKGAVITKEVGEFFTDSSSFLTAVDGAIKDDGTIQQNSIAEVLSAGKQVIAEGKDVIISIKPKT